MWRSNKIKIKLNSLLTLWNTSVNIQLHNYTQWPPDCSAGEHYTQHFKCYTTWAKTLNDIELTFASSNSLKRRLSMHSSDVDPGIAPTKW